MESANELEELVCQHKSCLEFPFVGWAVTGPYAAHITLGRWHGIRSGGPLWGLHVNIDEKRTYAHEN